MRSEAKHIATELKQHDINALPLPYANACFQCIVSCGVLHFFGDLKPVFREISRMIEPEGIFSFTIRAGKDETRTDAPLQSGYRSETSPEGVEIFTHDERYIRELLRLCGFESLKTQLMPVKHGGLYAAHVARKI